LNGSEMYADPQVHEQYELPRTVGRVVQVGLGPDLEEARKPQRAQRGHVRPPAVHEHPAAEILKRISQVIRLLVTRGTDRQIDGQARCLARNNDIESQVIEVVVAGIRRYAARSLESALQRAQLEPIGEAEFAIPTFDLVLHFEQVEDGTAKRMVILQRGMILKLMRIDAATAGTLKQAITERIKDRTPMPGSEQAVGDDGKVYGFAEASSEAQRRALI